MAYDIILIYSTTIEKVYQSMAHKIVASKEKE